MDWINFMFASCAPIAWTGVAINRFALKRGMGGRSIQFALAATVAPALITGLFAHPPSCPKISSWRMAKNSAKWI